MVSETKVGNSLCCDVDFAIQKNGGHGGKLMNPKMAAYASETHLTEMLRTNIIAQSDSDV